MPSRPIAGVDVMGAPVVCVHSVPPEAVDIAYRFESSQPMNITPEVDMTGEEVVVSGKGLDQRAT